MKDMGISRKIDELGRVVLPVEARRAKFVGGFPHEGITWDCMDFKAGGILINKQLQKRPLKDGGFTFDEAQQCG